MKLVRCAASSPFFFAESSRSVLSHRCSPIQSRAPWKTQHGFKDGVPGGARELKMRCSNPAGITNATTELPELTSQNFYQFLKETDAKLVVVDFYTDWCGPCKLMYPELVLMQQQFQSDGVQIVKFNCNKANKEVGKQLNIRVAPTFFLYKNGEKVAEMTGAKSDQLRLLIKEQL